jgi:hypothetical protein
MADRNRPENRKKKAGEKKGSRGSDGQRRRAREGGGVKKGPLPLVMLTSLSFFSRLIYLGVPEEPGLSRMGVKAGKGQEKEQKKGPIRPKKEVQ